MNMTKLSLSLFVALLVFSSAVHGGPIAADDLSVTSRMTRRRLRRRCMDQEPLTCFLRPTNGNTAQGRIRFTPEFKYRLNFRNSCNIRVVANLTGLTPGTHGWHIHTYGDLRTTDGLSTGGHLTNPAGDAIAHGLPDSRVRHWGDFGNIVADANGNAVSNSLDRLIRMKGIAGRGFILHALEDQGPDAQPTGASGSRQAQCVIGFENPNL